MMFHVHMHLENEVNKYLLMNRIYIFLGEKPYFFLFLQYLFLVNIKLSVLFDLQPRQLKNRDRSCKP